MQLTAPPNPITPRQDTGPMGLRLPAPIFGKRPVTSAIAALALAATGCAQMPLKEGPRAKLIRGVETPRDRNNMDITVYKVPITAWPKCLEIVAAKNPVIAVASALTLSVIHACAHVPRDRALKAGQRPWCIVAVPAGDDDTLEHELRHCEGWDHPRSMNHEKSLYVDHDGRGSEALLSARREERRE